MNSETIAIIVGVGLIALLFAITKIYEVGKKNDAYIEWLDLRADTEEENKGDN